MLGKELCNKLRSKGYEGWSVNTSIMMKKISPDVTISYIVSDRKGEFDEKKYCGILISAFNKDILLNRGIENNFATLLLSIEDANEYRELGHLIRKESEIPIL